MIDFLFFSIRKHCSDLIFLILLLIVNAFIFSVFRIVPIENPYLGFSCFIGELLWLSTWFFYKKKPALAIESKLFNRSDLFALIVFFSASVFVFFPLSRIHFDTGTDLSVAFGVDEIWFKPWAELNRPLASLGPMLAMFISSDGLGGYFIVNTFCRFAIAALIFGYLRLVIPKRTDVSFIAGLLYIFNTAELSRFNLWSIYYQVAVFFFALSCFLFVLSYRRGSRVLLIMACAFFACSFLQYEHVAVMSLAIPFCLLGVTRSSHLIVWIFAWLGTWLVFASRLITYLSFGPAKYQTLVFKAGSSSRETTNFVELIFDNFFLQMSPLFQVIKDIKSLSVYPVIALLIFLAVFIITIFFLTSQRNIFYKISSKSQLMIVASGLIATMLGVAVYLPFPVTNLIPDYGNHPTMRYQFFAGLGQAVFWAAIVTLIGNTLKNPGSRNFLTSSIVALICASATAESLRYQYRGGDLNPYYRYEIASKVLLEIDRQLPKILPGDDIFIELEDSDRSPIGWNYTGFHWSCRLFGIPMQQGRIAPSGKVETRLFSYSNAQHSPTQNCVRTHRFKVSEGGDVSFQGTVENEFAPASKCVPCVLKPYKRNVGEGLPFVLP